MSPGHEFSHQMFGLLTCFGRRILNMSQPLSAFERNTRWVCLKKGYVPKIPGFLPWFLRIVPMKRCFCWFINSRELGWSQASLPGTSQVDPTPREATPHWRVVRDPKTFGFRIALVTFADKSATHKRYVKRLVNRPWICMNMYECCGYCWTFHDISVFGSSYIFFLLCASARQLEQKDLRLAGEEKLHLRLKATLHGEVDSRLTDGYGQSEDQADTGRSLYYGPIKRAEFSNWYCIKQVRRHTSQRLSRNLI